MANEIKRPGRELANRPLYFFWIVDCSGSMTGEKIGTVNNAIQTVIPYMRKEAEGNPNAQLLVRALSFSDGARWITTEPVKIDTYAWDDLKAGGLTEFGAACELLKAQLTIPPMPERALPPVLVLLSDGHPTDGYTESMKELLALPWVKKAVRVAISIGRDADDAFLEKFTGNPELVLQANNASMLTKMIKWASTIPNVVSAPPSDPGSRKKDSQDAGKNDGAGQKDGDGAATNDTTQTLLDLKTIPEETTDEKNEKVW